MSLARCDLATVVIFAALVFIGLHVLRPDFNVSASSPRAMVCMPFLGKNIVYHHSANSVPRHDHIL